jgi:cobalt-zinc-cadmium resistance protein CzcA
MLDKIIYFSIKNKLVIFLFIIGLIGWGIYSLKNLPIDAVPDITNNQVQIVTMTPSLATEEVEKFVTFSVEKSMASIPGIEEMRSISRFGLSVVTIVFDEKTDVYWARQQVSERLSKATAMIPTGAGMPELMPVTTGLGEIYQYVIHPKKGFEQKYDVTELRTIQDWIIRSQLLGTPGVADVSSFGGYVKQYEVAVNPEKLRSMNVTIDELFSALSKNNQNTGGAYIDKNPGLYFIRSIGLVGSLQDIEKIVVKNTSTGIPVLIRNVADVHFGHANRFGAMSRNTEGEVVGGIVMMVKGDNSSLVIKNVKDKIRQIEKSLPEGVVIEPFLDRTKLVNNAIGTVTKNLAEGALIVIFVLVLLLGNIRAGLIVASVIPLAMLFAVSMMNLFGVSGNLMSLGAIDFGLIVDGAVIIVEATLHHFQVKFKTNVSLTQEQRDEEIYHSASAIRSSAAFGEIIILIVYLPLLALTGVEGKMFKPMAQTVSFAIIGAFILSLTYVPMISALMLKVTSSEKENISDKIIRYMKKIYQPLLLIAIRRKVIVVGCSVVLLLISIGLFSTLGGEFIPTLDEGDFAVETRLMPGSSLMHTLEVTEKASGILLKKFPEVKEVIGKIGTSEIPTDPMPIEACDLMIILKDKEEWVSASSREELAEKMTKELSVLSGVNFSFQQPIQMRFNELMTGAKQDVAVKIYGEDLQQLSKYADLVASVVGNTNGAQDLYVEQVLGLPQIVVKLNRDKIARYGLNIEAINQTVNIAFAGQSSGLVYEGGKRFELVLRLNENSRQDISDLSKLFIHLPNGGQLPLEQIADISYQSGPNQIQHENAKRTILVGFNVRGRDVESIVAEIDKKVTKKIKFMPGYFIQYGGTFKNLQEARTRLSIVVPVSLLMIFVLLYLTFNSVKQSLLIYSAIPLSAIGGIMALFIRGMPFSISAGVGFIALFGVAVLNGIVLIGEFNRLKKEGITNITKLVLTGTDIRFRPVIMTAMVASLGFLPMALSGGAGAEVQKPLATVVIGGLVSSTILTLLVLPVLFILFNKQKNEKSSSDVS